MGNQAKLKSEKMVRLPLSRIAAIEERLEALEARLEWEHSSGEEAVPASVVTSLIEGQNPVRVWRKHRRMTLKELSDASAKSGHRVDLRYISEIERGQKPGSVAALRALAAALNLDLDDLVKSGEFVTKRYAVDHANTTVKEKIPNPGKSPDKNK